MQHHNINMAWLMQVCGDECRVEVLLSNPCAVAIKLEQLVLDVSFNAALSISDQQQQQQQHQQAESSATGISSSPKGTMPSAGDDASSSGTPAASGAAVGYRLRPVAVTLSAKRKDLRLLLALTPTRPGALTIKGIKVHVGCRHTPVCTSTGVATCEADVTAATLCC